MPDTPSHGSNLNRIRQLEREVESLKQKLIAVTSGSTLNPVARTVKIPPEGIPGRVDDEPGVAVCRNVWLNGSGKLYLPGGPNETVQHRTAVFNILADEVRPGGENLALALLHDDGYWWLHGFDCKDNGSGGTIDSLAILPILPNGGLP